ncbi:unnamed protein product [Knipowitschia caucasica]
MSNGFWFDQYCTSTYHFVCYRVQPSGLKEYFLIEIGKTRSDSQSYCRQKYQDLATIQTPSENQAVKDLLPSSTSIVWIGLYRVSWRWSDGSPSTFRSWSPANPSNSGGSEYCATQSGSYVWNDAPSYYKYKFICQEDAISRTQIKITLRTTANMSEKEIIDTFLQALGDGLGLGFSVRWHRLPTRSK